MGFEYARQLAAKGCRILLVSNQAEQLEQSKKSIAVEYGVEVRSHFQNLASPDAAEELLSFCHNEGINVDVLVCNAGMFFFEELGSGNIKKTEIMLNLHVTANTKLCVLFGEEMKKRGSGTIIIMSSMASRLPAPGITVYAATKAYLRSFGKSLSFEMLPCGVSVTTVCPAAIATPLYNLSENLLKFGVNIGVINTPKWLVRRAIRAAQHNRRVIDPAFMNIYLPPMLRLLPACVENYLWKRFKK